MNVGVKDITMMLSFHKTYKLDIAEIKLCISKQNTLCEGKIKLHKQIVYITFLDIYHGVFFSS